MMNTTNPHAMTAEERREAWASGYAYKDNPNFWNTGECVGEMLLNALENVESLVGEEHAAKPLRALLETVVQQSGTRGANWSWRQVFEEEFGTAGTAWEVSDKLHHAGLYGLYGVLSSRLEIPPEERAAWLDKLVADVAALAARPDLSATVGPDNAVVRVARIAQSRRALDTGQGEVDIGSMAILGDVSEGRVRNLMSGEAPVLERGQGGGITAVSALAWLQKRKEFHGSIWDREEPSDEPDPAPISPSRMIFVPVARDGSMFHPGLKRTGSGYQIGAKGEEQSFEIFDDALSALNAMPVPRWRRPNEHGNWGIVSGVTWQRLERPANAN